MKNTTNMYWNDVLRFSKEIELHNGSRNCLSQSLQRWIAVARVERNLFITILNQEKMATVFENRLKSRKSHSSLRPKRATFTFWVDESSLKMPKMVHFGEFLNNINFCQTVLPDRSTLNWTKIGGKWQNCKKNATFWIFFKHCTWISYYQWYK